MIQLKLQYRQSIGHSFDVAFIALHGRYGEDGQIQQELEQIGLPYTGSGPQASHLAFHKVQAKEKFRQHQMPTPDDQIIDAKTWRNSSVSLKLELPVVVKPASEGSSFGVSLVHEAKLFAPAVEKALEYDTTILIETALLGEEWTVPFLDDVALPPIQIGTRRPFFDFSAKYEDENTSYEVVTENSNPQIQNMINIAHQAIQALGTTGITRVDLRCDHAGNPYVLEVNTIPGMTSHSLVPKSAKALGWSFTELCERAIQSALDRK